MSRVLLPLFLLFLVTACATSPEGRSQLVAPAPLQGFSAVYSEFDMHLQLVTAADAPACQDAQCVADRAFDQRVLALGRRLAVSAFRQHADLYLRFPRFEFIVVDKVEPGAASSAGGTVVVYRGLQAMNLDDAALAFVLAREMSHIIAGHHDENVDRQRTRRGGGANPVSGAEHRRTVCRQRRRRRFCRGRDGPDVGRILPRFARSARQLSSDAGARGRSHVLEAAERCGMGRR
jgi:hypothetical protein